MQDYIYSSIAILAIVIHLIINFNMFSGRRGYATAYGNRYRGFLMGIFAYYVVDVGWGVFAGLGWTHVLYANTVLYYIAIAMTVVMWCRYVVAYLDLGKWTGRPLLWFGYALLALYVVLLTVNVFNGCVFHFDEQGRYVAGGIRMLIFYPLAAIYVLTGLFVLARVLGRRDFARRRNIVALLFCLTMAVAIVLQIVWPLWPFYALGCLVGNCFFHIFVVEDELAELRQAVIEREQAAKHAAKLEKALERARAAEKAKSMFFSIVSHDIRTPLNAILGYSELLQFGIEDKSERDEALNSIRASGKTLLYLVNDVLDLAKIDSGEFTLQPEPVSLSPLVDEVFSVFRLTATGKGVELVNKTADVPVVLLDGHHFRQILFNLVGNAVKFTAKGRIEIRAAFAPNVTGGTGVPPVRDANGTLRVEIEDTGCGIEPDLMPRIFDPFVQAQDPSHSVARAGGTGLGLSICRRLVEAMGGEIDVKSELGKGSTFRVCIPGVIANSNAVNRAHSPSPIPRSPFPVPHSPFPVPHLPQRVLIVDDSPINREVLASLLAHAGVVSVDQACDGGEALLKLGAALETGHPYDFVFADLWMPNLNGIELIEKLRDDSRFSRLPVYAVTADTEFLHDDRNKLFTGILLKPITYDKLMGSFAKTCSSKAKGK